MNTDTIAAIATAVSDSGIGIIRISGGDAIEVADRIYLSKNQKKIFPVSEAIQFIMGIFMMGTS